MGHMDLIELAIHGNRKTTAKVTPWPEPYAPAKSHLTISVPLFEHGQSA